MRFRTVLAATHDTERALSRHIEPRGLGYQLTLLLHVIHHLNQREGHKPWHPVTGLLALILTDMGVVVTRYSLQPPPQGHAVAEAGVLDNRHHAFATEDPSSIPEPGLSKPARGAP